MFTSIILTLSLSFASTPAPSGVQSIPDCADGSLTVQDNGWLASDSDPRAVDYHAVLEDVRIAGVPDHVWYKADREGKAIVVCRMFDNHLVYGVR